MLDKLVANATEYTDHKTPVEIVVAKQSGHAVLHVKNTGRPLPDNPAVLFELFASFRTESSQTTEHYGLGLYLVKLIAESHGGQARAYSLDGNQGAVFEVILPLSSNLTGTSQS